MIISPQNVVLERANIEEEELEENEPVITAAELGLSRIPSYIQPRIRQTCLGQNNVDNIDDSDNDWCDQSRYKNACSVYILFDIQFPPSNSH